VIRLVLPQTPAVGSICVGLCRVYELIHEICCAKTALLTSITGVVGARSLNSRACSVYVGWEKINSLKKVKASAWLAKRQGSQRQARQEEAGHVPRLSPQQVFATSVLFHMKTMRGAQSFWSNTSSQQLGETR
jgi:hypothetical protein